MIDIKKLSEEKFLDLIESKKLRLKTKEELIAEGWQCDNNTYSKLGVEIDCYKDILYDRICVGDIEEVDLSDYSFRVNNALGLMNDWYPMEIFTDASSISIEPIKLNIPTEKEMLLLIN